MRQAIFDLDRVDVLGVHKIMSRAAIDVEPPALGRPMSPIASQRPADRGFRNSHFSILA
jgi:hypothetical protein